LSQSDNHEYQENRSISEPTPVLGDASYWILVMIGAFTIILGLFSILSVIIVSLQHSQLNYTSGFLIGLLLVLGGSILIIGGILLRRSPPSSKLS
jgi:hypothetical protein